MTNDEFNNTQDTDFETIEVGETGGKKKVKVIFSSIFLILIAVISILLIYSFTVGMGK